MLKPFILGLEDSVQNTSFRSTENLYKAVGHNTGNLAFHRAIKQILGKNVETAPWTADASQMSALGDIGVIPCANQVGSHTDLGRSGEAFAKLDCKLVGIGLGAQGDQNFLKLPNVPDGTIRWIEEIGKRAPGSGPNITVRGPYTKQVLDHYGVGHHAVVLGCPTLFINPEPQLGKLIAARAANSNFDRVSVSAAHFGWKHLSRLEISLARVMSRCGGSYIVQSPIEMVAMARSDWSQLSEETVLNLKNFTAPELTVEEFKEWCFKHARAYFDISAWMETLRTYDLVIGARIHGVMLALQAGVPGLCIAHDSRTRELCETMKVPFVMASEISAGITREKLISLFNFDGEEFDRNRLHLGKAFAAFLRSNELVPDAAFNNLISAQSTHAKAPAIN